MWHRTDNFRQGRVHPMCTSRVRVVLLGRQRAELRPAPHERRHRLHPRAGGDPERDVRDLPEANSLGYSQAVFTLTANVPYNFGVVTQLLNEIYDLRHVQHQQRAQHLQPRGVHRHRADGRPGRARRWARTRTSSAARSSATSRLEAVLDAGRQGRALGSARWLPGTAQGIGDPQRVQEPRGLPGRDRLHARRPSTARSRTATRDRG